MPAEVARTVEWRVTTRPWSYGYEDGSERFGAALAEIRKELGFETTDEFATWIYEEGQRQHPSNNLDVPSVLIDAFEFPAVGWESSMYLIDSVAQVLKVSPGTLIDELWLRASVRFREDGTEVEE